MSAPLDGAVPFDFLTRRPGEPLARFVESIWYARGTVPYTRERIAPTGSTVAVFVLGDPILQIPSDGAGDGLAKHGQIVSHLKTVHGLTHGNANLVAHKVREALDGGPPPAADLLAAQYRGRKAALRPIYDEVAAIAGSFGTDVDTVVQKTGVSFRRRTQFALVQAPSAKRVRLGLKLDATPDDPRVREVSGMCSHEVDLTAPGDVDDDVVGWLQQSYEQAG